MRLEFYRKEVAVRSMRPVCGRCHEEVVGVVPVWLDDKPICRNCAFSVSFRGDGTDHERTADYQENNGVVRSPSRIRPGIGLLVLIAGIIIIGLKAGEFIKALEPDRPQYRGAAGLDRETESCISNLWKITRVIQDEDLRWPNVNCPSTSTPYRTEHVLGNSIVSCPNPKKHDVVGIQVSRTSPVPEVEL
jgi:hypothetical protein